MYYRLVPATCTVLASSFVIFTAKLSSFPNSPCNSIDWRFEEPAKSLRTVQLPTLGITVEIPRNFRMVQFQDGRIEIVNPGEFKFLECIAKYGRTGLRGGGRYAQSFKPLTQSEAILLVETQRKNGNNISQYSKGDLNGFIVSSQIGYSASFIGVVPDRTRLGRMSHFEVVISCDCPVEVSELMELLIRIKPMP